MKIDTDLIANILTNTVVPASLAARSGPRADLLIARFCVGPIELMRLLRDIENGELPRNDLRDLADLLCRIERWAENGIRTTNPADLSKRPGREYLWLFTACVDVLWNFDDDHIPESHNRWRQARVD